MKLFDAEGIDVFHRRLPGDGIKVSDKVIIAHKAQACQRIDADLVHIVGLDVTDNRLQLLVLRRSGVRNL